jgi:hypothetical protein
VRKREKIEEKRKIRAAYKSFKIDIHPDDREDMETEVIDGFLNEAKRRCTVALNDLIQKDSQRWTEGVLKRHRVIVHSVDMNPSMSLCYAFFEVYGENMTEPVDPEIQEAIRRRLIHSVPFFRGKLVQNAKLKYAPDLRFVPYKFGMPKT